MKLRTESVFVRLQFLTLVGIVVTQVLGKQRLASMLFAVTFVLTLGTWLAVAARKVSGRNVLVILILAASCISVMGNALLSGTLVSFSYFKKLIIFWSTILLWGAMGDYSPKDGDVRFVFQWNTVLVCFLIAVYFIRKEQMYMINGIVTIYLTFRFTNPNLAAVFLSAMCVIELIHGAVAQKWGKMLHMVLAGILVFFVFQTRARNAQLLLAFFLTVYLAVMLLPRWRPGMHGWMAALIAVFPLLFAVGYLQLVDLPAVEKHFSFLIGEGKGLDSRVEIWSFALSAFRSSPLFGAYSQISDGTGASQMHNSHLDILASYGAAVFAMVCILLTGVLNGRQELRGDRVHFLCQMGFAALLFSGVGEAMLFSGGMGIYLFAGVLLMLGNFDFENGMG